MFDSYYHPKYLEGDESDPFYVDWGEMESRLAGEGRTIPDLSSEEVEKLSDEFTRQNDQWEPALIQTETVAAQQVEELFQQIQILTSRWEREWDKMEGY